MTGFLFLVPLLLQAQQLFVCNYHVLFNDTANGVPVIDLTGAYTFEVTPPTVWIDTSASYYDSIRSGSFILNGLTLAGDLSNSSLQVDNNLPVDGGLRDTYFSMLSLSNITVGNVVLEATGLDFEQRGPSPSALNSLAIPTTTSDLTGFLNSERLAFLVVYRIDLDSWYNTTAQVDSFSITPIPEPSSAALILLGALALYLPSLWRCNPQ